jgi:glycosyltransferase involved in cell wall biosynthesis
MKVLFLSENPATQIGGIENHIRHIGKILEEGMHSVNYFSAKELATRTVVNKQIVSMKVIKKNIVSIMPDVIHVHGFSSFFVYQCLSVIKRILPNAKLIYTPHYHPFQYHNHPLFATAFFHIFLKRSFKHIDTLVVLTQNEKDFFGKYFDESKIKIIPNGITSRFALDIKERSNENSILFVGREDHNKRLDFLESQRAYFEYSQIKCHIVTNEKKVSNEIFTYYTDLSSTQLRKLYKKCTLLVVPSKYEAFSLVALEAMSYGMPVLISDRVQIKSYFSANSAFNKVFKYDDTADFIVKLESILNISNETYQQLSKKNIEFTQSFDWGIIAKKLLVIYQEES